MDALLGFGEKRMCVLRKQEKVHMGGKAFLGSSVWEWEDTEGPHPQEVRDQFQIPPYGRKYESSP